MTAEEILDVLYVKRITQAKIARECKVSQTMIHYVIHGKSKSRRIQETIARILGKTVEEVWPPKAA